MNPAQTVAAVQYEVKVFEGTMDFVHGGGRNIKEVFIPTYQVIFNSEGFIFKREQSRFKEREFNVLKDILLPLELVKKIELIANLNLEIASKKKEVTQDLKELFI